MKSPPVASSFSSGLPRFFLFFAVLGPDLVFFDLDFFALVFLVAFEVFFFAIVESHDDSKWRVVERVC